MRVRLDEVGRHLCVPWKTPSSAPTATSCQRMRTSDSALSVRHLVRVRVRVRVMCLMMCLTG